MLNIVYGVHKKMEQFLPSRTAVPDFLLSSTIVRTMLFVVSLTRQVVCEIGSWVLVDCPEIEADTASLLFFFFSYLKLCPAPEARSTPETMSHPINQVNPKKPFPAPETHVPPHKPSQS